MVNNAPRRKVFIDSDGRSAHTESPIDVELEATDIM